MTRNYALSIRGYIMFSQTEFCTIILHLTALQQMGEAVPDSHCSWLIFGKKNIDQQMM